MQESKTRVKALDQGNCDVARRRGKEAYVKAASPRTETCSEADGRDELAQHSEILDSLPEVKHGVVQSKFTLLLGETCPPSGRSRERANGTVTGNRHGERTGVSRGHSSAGSYEPGVGVHLPRGALKGPEGLTHARRTKLIGTAETAAAFRSATTPYGRAEPGRTQAAEKDRGQGELGIAYHYPSPTMASAVT
jgi:hypothetical protein